MAGAGALGLGLDEEAVEDLADLEEQDLLEIGMKRIEVKRLQRIAAQ